MSWRRGGRRAWRVVHSAARIGAVLVVLFFVGLEVVVSWGNYDVSLLGDRPGSSLVVEGRDGVLLSERVNERGERHRWTALADISPWVVEGTVAVEDARFFEHDGVDWRAVGRAARGNIRAGRLVSGASTITMQLTRLIQPRVRRSWAGKLLEVVRALRLERVTAKTEILEQYLNRAPYGAGAIGIEAASWRYFGRPSKQLTMSQASLLIGLPGAPSKFNPLRHYERAMARRAVVLRRLFETGKITAGAYIAAQAERPVLRPLSNPNKAPHLADLLSDREVNRDAEAKQPWPLPPATTTVHRSFVDPTLQADVAALVADQVKDLALFGAPHAAAVVVDNARCEVVTLVGSPGYRTALGAVNGATALRQPGSTLKPFVYALAFERGANEATIVADVPTRYRSPNGTLHSPRNYDRTYAGPVPMGRALAASLNVPAIVTAQREGLGRLHRTLKALGFDSLDKPSEHYGLGLALGNGEVRLTELAQGYAALARAGRACRLRITSTDPVVDQPVFRPETAARITSILADENLRGEAFGIRGALMLQEAVALKTGTSANWRDSWVVGYTGDHTVAVWVGDFANRTTAQLTGLTGAGPLFRRIAERVIQGVPKAVRRPLIEPAISGRLRVKQVCALSGQAPGPACPHRVTAAVDPFHDNQHRSGGHDAGIGECQWHRRVRVHRPTGLLAGPTCRPEDTDEVSAAYLPATYAEWQASYDRPTAPTHYAEACPAPGEGGLTAKGGGVAVSWPMPNDTFVMDPLRKGDSQTLRFRVAVAADAGRATWWVNGERVAEVGWPYELVWPLKKGKHVVQVAAGGVRSAAVRFSVK